MPLGDEHGPAPTREVGKVLNTTGYIAPWTDLTSFDELETNPKLAFPESVFTYHSMLTDPQVQGLRTGTTWPIYRMLWYLDPNGARDEIVQKHSADFNLPIAEDPKDIIENISKFKRRRTQNRFNFLQHLEEALDAIVYGFKVFEQNGYIGTDGNFHYKKLADRPPQTIKEIHLAEDGGVIDVEQIFMSNDGLPIRIPIDQLVFYTFGKRGANWHGRSLLRGCYAPHVLKDKAMRVGVMNIQKAGVGTPIFTAPPGASETDIKALGQMAKEMMAGDRSGGAVPYGALAQLLGITGSQPDTVGFIKLMNEEMARSFFQMFMQLGQTTSGSRALGQTFVQYHKLVIEYVASWFALIFNEHVVEDDVEWNYGPEEEYAPLLCWAWDEEGSDENPEGPEAAARPTSQYERLTEEGSLVLPDDILEAIHQPSRSGRGRRRAERRRNADGARPSAAASNGGSNG